MKSTIYTVALSIPFYLPLAAQEPSLFPGREALLQVSEVQAGAQAIAQNASSPQAQEPYYYYDGKRVPLGRVPFAEVWLVEGVDPSAVGITPKNLVEEIGGAKIVRVEGPDAFDPSQAVSRPHDFEAVLPVIVLADGTRWIFSWEREIASSFGPKVDVEAYAARFGLVLSRDLGTPLPGNPPGWTFLKLAQGPVTTERLLQAANGLYEAGRADGSVRFSGPMFRPLDIEGVPDDRTFLTPGMRK